MWRPQSESAGAADAMSWRLRSSGVEVLWSSGGPPKVGSLRMIEADLLDSSGQSGAEVKVGMRSESRGT